MNFIIALWIISGAILIIPGAIWLLRRIFAKPSCENRNKSGISSLLIFSAIVILSVWCNRYMVGFFRIVCESLPVDWYIDKLTWYEEIANSLVHALQTMSMDEDYTVYLTAGKEMIAVIFPDHPRLVAAFSIQTSLLNVIAPIAGGAVLLDILAGIFPRLRLSLCLFFTFWREKYYFSELNEQSLALAKNKLTGISFFKRPIIVFTDVYVDDENEKNYELFKKVKNLGAICVRDDITHVKKAACGQRHYILVDENEAANLKCLANLAASSKKRYLKSRKHKKTSHIYLFSQSDAYVQVEHSVRDMMQNDLGFDEAELPEILPIQKYRNMVCRLLEELPLYEPLVKMNENAEKELNIVIVGAGATATEMFLSSYWFCQMLNVKTTVTVIAKESRGEFINRIDSVNPEILQTVYETGTNSPVSAPEGTDSRLRLKYDHKGGYSEPYCYLAYKECDVYSSEFVSSMSKEPLSGANYVFVALGTDQDNISTANTVCRLLGEAHLNEKAACPKTVIAYVVYNSDLANTLNHKKTYSFGNDPGGGSDIYMEAMGDLDDLFSWENICMTAYESRADMLHKSYLKNSGADRKKRNELERDIDYKYWMNIARAMHLKYKAFSLGFAKYSVFDKDMDDAKHKAAEEKMIDAFRNLVIAPFTDPAESDKNRRRLHLSAWLEHRRWNAFTRIKGFRCPEDIKALVEATGEHKHMELKLHGCLVECSTVGTCLKIEASGKINGKATRPDLDESEFDLLDEVRIVKEGKEAYSKCFKQYDYPIEDFRALSIADASSKFEISKWKIFLSCVIGYWRRNVKAESKFVEFILRLISEKVYLNPEIAPKKDKKKGESDEPQKPQEPEDKPEDGKEPKKKTSAEEKAEKEKAKAKKAEEKEKNKLKNRIAIPQTDENLDLLKKMEGMAKKNRRRRHI